MIMDQKNISWKYLAWLLIVVNVIQLYFTLQEYRSSSNILKTTTEKISNYYLENNKLKTLIQTLYSTEFSYPKCLSNILSDTSNLVLIYIPPNICETCIIETLGNVDILADKIGRNNIGIIVGVDSLDSFESIINRIPVKFGLETYCTSEQFKSFPTDKVTVFMLNKIRGIHMVFVPDLFQEFSETYFFEIVQSHFNN